MTDIDITWSRSAMSLCT